MPTTTIARNALIGALQPTVGAADEHPRLLGQPAERDHQPVADDRGHRAAGEHEQAGRASRTPARPAVGSRRARSTSHGAAAATRAATSVHDWRATISLRTARSSRRKPPSVRSTWPSSRPPTRCAITSVATTRSAVGIRQRGAEPLERADEVAGDTVVGDDGAKRRSQRRRDPARRRARPPSATCRRRAPHRRAARSPRASTADGRAGAARRRDR